jgi:hypothetical protein
MEPSAPLLDAPCPQCGHLIRFPTSEDATQETRRYIKGLVVDIHKLANSDVAPAVFYERFLLDVVRAVAAVSGELWTRGDCGRLEVQSHVNNLFHDRVDLDTREACVAGVLAQGKPELIRDEPWIRHTGCVMIVAPLVGDNELSAAVALFLDQTRRQTALENAPVFVGELCEVASGYFRRQRLRAIVHASELTQELPSWRLW